MGTYLTAPALSALAGIPERAALAALQGARAGARWHGADLTVIETADGLAAHADSLPESLRQSHYLQEAEAAGVAFGLAATPAQQAGMAVALHRYSLIHRAAAEPKHSRTRRAALAAALERATTHPWRRERITEGTLYAWLRDYESRGLTGLLPAARSDQGQRRILIARAWDQAAAGHLEADDRARIAAELERYIRSAWRSGVHGWRQIVELASARLQALCAAAGWEATAAACKLNRATVERYRDYALVRLEEADAKSFFDHWLPRISRTRATLEPMDLVVGDVHPIDILLHRPDGSDVYARAIAWQDVATNRVWLTLIMLRPGEGVRREHIALSFASMCAVWGLPRRLYLDNGSEYNWAEMIAGFSELARLRQQIDVRLLDQDQPLRAIIRARPYNAPAKCIEGFFSVLEAGYLSQITGWVGGDRTAKKTHNVGQAPLAFRGDWPEFHRVCDVAMERYHKREQDTLDGRSPNEVLGAWIDRGWTKTAVHEAALLLAFSIEDTRLPDRGRIWWDATPYYHDALLPIGRRVRVRVPKHDPRMIFVFDGPRLLCAATPDPRYDPLDGTGAAEQSRRAGVLRRHVAELRKHCDRLDLVEEMATWNATRPDAPPIPTGAQVALTEDVRQMLEAARAVEDQALDAARAGQASAGPRRLSQWSQDGEQDEFRSAVGWAD